MKTPRQARIKQELVAAVEADLLKRLRMRGGIPRVDLAREMQLAPSTVGIYVDRLVADGYLKEGKQISRDLGRPPTLLTLNPEGGRFIGVDVEAHNLRAICVDFSQQPIKELHRKLPRKVTLKQMQKEMHEILEEVAEGDDRPLLGIGVCVPGEVDSENGIAIHFEHMKGWDNLPIAQEISEKFNVPVTLENNIRSMAVAEMWFGLGRDVSSFLCLGIRSGIGAGVVVNGSLIHGNDFLAGEIGTWPCFNENEKTFLTLEELASVGGLLERWNSKRNQPSDWKETSFLQAADKQDSAAEGLLNEAAHACGTTLGQINLLLNPPLIIIAGPLSELEDAFMEPLRKALRSVAPAKHAAVPEVKASLLGKYVGALGAAALAVQQWKPAR